MDALLKVESRIGWRLLAATVGLQTLALAYLHLGNFYREAHYSIYRDAFGDLRLWGFGYLLAAAILLLPAYLLLQRRYSRLVWMVQNLTMLTVSGWVLALTCLSSLGALHVGLTPAALAFIPWPVFVSCASLVDIWDSRVSFVVPIAHPPAMTAAPPKG